MTTATLTRSVPPHVVRDIAGHFAHGNLAAEGAAALAQLGEAVSGGLWSPLVVNRPTEPDEDQHTSP